MGVVPDGAHFNFCRQPCFLQALAYIDHITQLKKAQALKLSRSELSLKLDRLKEEFVDPGVTDATRSDLWCELAEHLEIMLDSCAGEDLSWFHARTDALIDLLFVRTFATLTARDGERW